MSVLMEDGAPVVLGGEIDGNKVTVFTSLKESREGDRLAFVQRRILLQLFSIAKGDDLQWHGNVHVDSLEDYAECGTHLLKALQDVASALFAGISEHGEMRRADFNPLHFCMRQAWNKEGNNQEKRKNTGLIGIHQRGLGCC